MDISLNDVSLNDVSMNDVSFNDDVVFPFDSFGDFLTMSTLESEVDYSSVLESIDTSLLRISNSLDCCLFCLVIVAFMPMLVSAIHKIMFRKKED